MRPQDWSPLLSLYSRAHTQVAIKHEVNVQRLHCSSTVVTPPRIVIRRLIHQHNAGVAPQPSKVKGKCIACACAHTRTHTHTTHTHTVLTLLGLHPASPHSLANWYLLKAASSKASLHRSNATGEPGGNKTNDPHGSIHMARLEKMRHFKSLSLFVMSPFCPLI